MSMKRKSAIDEKLLEEDISICSDSTMQISKPNACCSILNTYKYSIISTLITMILIAVPIIFYKKDIYQKHLDAPCLEVVNKKIRFLFWSIHCASLIILPIMMKYLFNDKLFEICYFAPPLMMFVNNLCYLMPISWYWLPFLIEYMISLFFLLRLPFKKVYLLKLEKFWAGELTLMLFNFVSISASLSACSLSYILFSRYMRLEAIIISWPINPKLAISYINIFKNSDLMVRGAFLSCYSLFTLFSVGHGFLLTFRNSKLMLIPFILLTLSTFFSNRIISYIFISQIIIHIIYLILLQFKTTRKFLASYGEFCNSNYVFKKTGKKAMATFLIGDIITFCFFVFPVFAFVLDGNKKEFPWGYFSGGVCVLLIGFAVQIYIMINEEGYSFLILSALCIAVSVYLFGNGFRGYLPFIKAYTFEITSLSWSIMLDLTAYNCGHSPFLYRIYRGIIVVASLIIIEFLESIGWMELLFGAAQFIINEFIITIIIKHGQPYFGWSMFASIGVGIFCPIPGIGLVIVLAFFFYCCC